MPEYVLQRPSAAPITPPVLDESQQAVLDHFAAGPGGPLQVLAGPGAGKTTALVELVVDRVENGGLSPDQILVLTFSRKAAQEIRSRIARRLARTTSTTPAMTFHSFCYALLRAEQSPTDFASPIRLLSAPENDAMIAEVLAGRRRRAVARGAPSGAAHAWPGLGAALAHRVGPRARHGRCRSRRRWRDARRPRRLEVGGTVLRRGHLGRCTGQHDRPHRPDLRGRQRCSRIPTYASAGASKLALVVVDEYQDTDPLQVELLKALAGDGRDLVVVGDPYQSIYGFRGADVRGIVDFPDQFATAAGPAPRITLGYTNRYGDDDRCGGALDRRQQGRTRRGRRHGLRRAPQPRQQGRRPRHGRGAHLLHADSRGRAHRADAARGPPARRRRRGATWRCWYDQARISAASSAPWWRRVCRSRWPVTSCRSRSSRPSVRCCLPCTPPTR